MQATTNNLNEWINWIEQANLIKRYKYEDLNNIKEIGSGSFGTVYRANWKNFHKYLALKSFFNLNNITAKEIIDEVNTYFSHNVIMYIYIYIYNTFLIFFKNIYNLFL
ncbi:hypothetical protein C1645_573851 [Glomus cerebriforme]|uniref:Protein kinase domain-containing protein n=1 Tax=Glomus cerebriforme TaxID=658196 RepID=A0A397TBI7_9GLOM|nr:hypothetical protein C1645_573851 [Glomus cerebriforme]